MSRKRPSSIVIFLRLMTYLAAAWVLGFGFYIISLPDAPEPAGMSKSEAIVVLTGGSGRLGAGVRLMEEKSANRMLISGVNPVVTADELTALTGADRSLFACCIDLDHASPDTAGNATESAKWARQHGFTSITLVTADYHMPRSLILFRNAMPEATIMAFAVDGDWPLGLLAKEYNKYLVTLGREAVGASRTKSEGHAS